MRGLQIPNGLSCFDQQKFYIKLRKSNSTIYFYYNYWAYSMSAPHPRPITFNFFIGLFLLAVKTFKKTIFFYLNNKAIFPFCYSFFLSSQAFRRKKKINQKTLLTSHTLQSSNPAFTFYHHLLKLCSQTLSAKSKGCFFQTHLPQPLYHFVAQFLLF